MSVAKNDSGTAFDHFNAAVSGSLAAYTISAGSDRVLVVALAFQVDVTGLAVTWNGVPLTRVGTGIFTSGAGRCEIWYLLNPDTGTQTLAASWTGSSSCVLTAITFSGGTTPNNPNTASASSATQTIDITSSAAGATVAVTANVTSNINSTDTQTELSRDNATNVDGACSYGLGGATNTHTWTQGVSGGFVAMGVHVPAVAAGVTAAQQAGIFDAQRSGGIIGRVDA